MGPKEVLKESLDLAKRLPKAAWIAAIIVPGGLTAISVYVIVKSIAKGKNK